MYKRNFFYCLIGIGAVTLNAMIELGSLKNPSNRILSASSIKALQQKEEEENRRIQVVAKNFCARYYPHNDGQCQKFKEILLDIGNVTNQEGDEVSWSIQSETKRLMQSHNQIVCRIQFIDNPNLVKKDEKYGQYLEYERIKTTLIAPFFNHLNCMRQSPLVAKILEWPHLDRDLLNEILFAYMLQEREKSGDVIK